MKIQKANAYHPPSTSQIASGTEARRASVMAFGRFKFGSTRRNASLGCSARSGDGFGRAVGSGTMTRPSAPRIGLGRAGGGAAGELPLRFALHKVEADCGKLRFQLFDRPGVVDGNRRLLARQ